AGIFSVSCRKDDRQKIRDGLRGQLTASFQLSSKWTKSTSGTRLPCNGKRRSLKDGSKGLKHGATLFAHRRKITANGTKSRGSLFTAKGAGNLLLDLHHAKISFGQIVGKRHPKIIQESEHLLGPFEKSVQQIFR